MGMALKVTALVVLFMVSSLSGAVVIGTMHSNDEGNWQEEAQE